MLKPFIFLALVSSAYSGAIVPSQPDPSGNTGIMRKDNAPSIPLLRHDLPGFPEYEPSKYKAYQLVPAQDSRQSSTGWASAIASGLVPLGSFALAYGGRAVLLIAQFVILMLVGIILTTSICTFTPFCTITFQGFGLTQHIVKEQVQELARAYITPEVLNMTSFLVSTAVENYMEANRSKNEEKPKGEKATTVGNPQRRRRRR